MTVKAAQDFYTGYEVGVQHAIEEGPHTPPVGNMAFASGYALGYGHESDKARAYTYWRDMAPLSNELSN